MGHRREPGEGQVNWDTARNTYIATLIVGKHETTGRNVLRTRYARVKGKTRAGYKDAEDRLQELKDELEAEQEAAAVAGDRAGYTLWMAITDWHQYAPTTGKTSQGTADKLRDSCKRWVHPDPDRKRDGELLSYLTGVGDTPLVDVDAALLVEHLRRVAPYLGKAGLGDILSTVRRSIRHQMQLRDPLVSRNVADDVDLPMAGKEPGEPTFLTKEQVDLVLGTTVGTRIHALMVIGFQLGLRPGEIRALKWSNLDFDKGRYGFLYVQKWARRGGDGKTKTAGSYRGLPLTRMAREALLEHRERWGDNEYVFPREDGVQLTKESLYWRVSQVFKDAGLDELDPYTMRHTFCSLAVDAGVPRRKVADAMGHANLTTFERIYRHRLRPEVTDGDDLWGGLWDDPAA